MCVGIQQPQSMDSLKWLGDAARRAYVSAYDTVLPPPSVAQVYAEEIQRLEALPVSAGRLRTIQAIVKFRYPPKADVVDIRVPVHMGADRQPYVQTSDVERAVRLYDAHQYKILSSELDIAFTNTMGIPLLVQERFLPPSRTGGRRATRRA